MTRRAAMVGSGSLASGFLGILLKNLSDADSEQRRKHEDLRDRVTRLEATDVYYHGKAREAAAVAEAAVEASGE